MSCLVCHQACLQKSLAMPAAHWLLAVCRATTLAVSICLVLLTISLSLARPAFALAAALLCTVARHARGHTGSTTSLFAGRLLLLPRGTSAELVDMYFMCITI